MYLEIISIIISAGALFFSIFAFFNSKKYKEIEKRLNELEIEEKIEKKHNKLKADIKVTYLGKNYFEIKNTGEVDAENLDIIDLNIDKTKIIESRYFPINRLKPNNSIRISIRKDENLKKFKIKLKWEDEFGRKFNKKRRYERKFNDI